MTTGCWERARLSSIGVCSMQQLLSEAAVSFTKHSFQHWQQPRQQLCTLKYACVTDDCFTLSSLCAVSLHTTQCCTRLRCFRRWATSWPTWLCCMCS